MCFFVCMYARLDFGDLAVIIPGLQNVLFSSFYNIILAFLELHLFHTVYSIQFVISFPIAIHPSKDTATICYLCCLSKGTCSHICQMYKLVA